MAHDKFLHITMRLKNVGTLDSIEDLQVAYAMNERITFIWKDPFTLKGVPIIKYGVHMELTSWLRGQKKVENITEISFNTSDKEVNATRVKTEDICTSVNLSVSAINMAGIGESASITSYFREGIAI